MQIGFDLQPRSAPEACAIDLQILHDALYVVAGLRERNLLDPIDRVDLGVARIAVAVDPFFDAAAASIIGRKRHDVGTAIILDQPAKLGRPQGCVVDRIGLQPAEIEACAIFLIRYIANNLAT